MNKNQYKLNYKIKLSGCEMKTGQYIVKNCLSLLHAKIKLHDYFEKQFKEIETVQIWRAEPEDLFDFLNGFNRKK